MTCKPSTTAASAAFSTGTSSPALPSARARHAMGSTPLTGRTAPVSASSPTMMKLSNWSDCELVTGRQHADGDGQIETRPLLFDIGRGQIDGRAAHGKLEPGIGQRRGDAVPRFLHRRIRQPDDDDDRIAPAGIDLHLDGEGFDSIDRGGQNTGQHGRILGERGRKGNAVLRPCPVEIDTPGVGAQSFAHEALPHEGQI